MMGHFLRTDILARPPSIASMQKWTVSLLRLVRRKLGDLVSLLDTVGNEVRSQAHLVSHTPLVFHQVRPCLRSAQLYRNTSKSFNFFLDLIQLVGQSSVSTWRQLMRPKLG